MCTVDLLRIHQGDSRQATYMCEAIAASGKRLDEIFLCYRQSPNSDGTSLCSLFMAGAEQDYCLERGRMQEPDLETLEKVCLRSEGAELDDSK